MVDLLGTDKALCKLEDELAFHKMLTPTNVNQERNRFFALYNRKATTDKQRDRLEQEQRKFVLQFRYKTPLPFNPQAHQKAITKLKTDDSAYGTLLEAKKEELILQVELLRALRGRNFTDISKELYGKPTRNLIEKSYELSKLTRVIQRQDMDVQEALAMLEPLMLPGFKLKTSAHIDQDASLSLRTETLYLSEKEKYSKDQIKRIQEHQIKTHIARYLAGLQTGIPLLWCGTAGHIIIEEGLGLEAEIENNIFDRETIRTYHQRVRAVDHALSGEPFVVAYEDALQNHIRPLKAFKIVSEAYLGGGFTKPLIHMKGYIAVTTYLDEGHDRSELMHGKYGIKDVKKVREILEAKGIPY